LTTLLLVVVAGVGHLQQEEVGLEDFVLVQD
jgi:hypothetical protein